MTARELQVLTGLRRIALALPEARETVTFGHPTFQAGTRTFAVLETYRGELSLAFKTEPLAAHARRKPTARAARHAAGRSRRTPPPRRGR